MKKMILPVLFALCLHTAQAQDEDKDSDKPSKPFFSKKKAIIGGGMNLSFFSSGSALGLNPHIGYSLTNWLDVAATFNWNYISQRDYVYPGDKIRQSTYAPGAFVRLYPVDFLFAHAQFEHSFIRQKYISPASFSAPDEITKFGANSLLLGLGYCSGRENGENTFYYFSLLFDVLEDPKSPYVDGYGRAYPIVRAGLNFRLFPNAR